MSIDDRSFLETTLAKLLGFEDGASDVLEHLLAIESSDDLLEYLTQLLGDPTPATHAFVDNMGRFQRGEKIIREDDGDDDVNGTSTVSEKKVYKNESVASSVTSANVDKKLDCKPSPVAALASAPKQAVQQSQRHPKHGKSRVPPPKKIQQAPEANKDSKSVARRKIEEPPIDKGSSAVELDHRITSEASAKVRPTTPTKGTAKRICGCYGTIHKPLTNCLYCGRISCSEEGYDFCPFCGYMVDEVRADIDRSNDESWMEKERLLRFDRESNQRTVIIDDQADYQGPSTWMTEEEIAVTEDNNKKQIEDLKRPKQVLNLTL